MQFSADGKRLATGSGDTTVRFWDLQTQLPLKDGRVHKEWVMACSWSPDAAYLASGDKSGSLCVWDASTAEPCGTCKGHTKWITAIAWQPAHLALPSRQFASASKDKSVRVWDATRRSQLLCMAGHTNTVNAVRWCGSGLLISGSSDREIRVWNAEDGRTVRVLSGHAHWVNSLALSTDYVLRTGAHDHAGSAPKDAVQAKQVRRPSEHGVSVGTCEVSVPRSRRVRDETVRMAMRDWRSRKGVRDTDVGANMRQGLCRWRRSGTMRLSAQVKSGWCPGQTTTRSSCGRLRLTSDPSAV